MKIFYNVLIFNRNKFFKTLVCSVRFGVPLIYQTETKNMKTTIEIRTAAYRVIEKIIILKANVFNGCRSDQKELDEQLKRLEGIKNWAISNNELTTIKNWFASKYWGNHLQFHAHEISKIFYA